MTLWDLNQQLARRQFLASGGAGIAGLAATAVLADEGVFAHASGASEECDFSVYGGWSQPHGSV